MRQLLVATTVGRRRVMIGAVAAATVGLMTAVAAGPAAADAGWSRVPASGLGGGTVRVASSSTALCQWVQPAPPEPGVTPDAPAAPTVDPAAQSAPVEAAAEDVTYDGTEVLVRLARDGIEVPLGSLPVTEGGAWSGTVTVPTAPMVIPGDYDLFVRCVIDRPELDGVRSYDFDPVDFTVTEGPPPTTIEVPTEIPPPLTITNPVQVQGEQLVRPEASSNTAASAPAPTLPRTGDGTVAIALAGIASLLVGGAALWWGARHARHQPGTDLVDGT